MLDLQATALRWLAAGRPAVVVEVRDAKGSVPREAGTRMLVAANDVALAVATWNCVPSPMREP
jgi:xanthine dehydrogenase accessory factor